jgi:hypothetical protein
MIAIKGLSALALAGASSAGYGQQLSDVLAELVRRDAQVESGSAVYRVQPDLDDTVLVAANTPRVLLVGPGTIHRLQFQGA